MQADRTDAAPAGCDYATVHVVFELSNSKWQLGVMTPGAEKMSRYRIDGGNLAELSHVLAKARAKAEQLGKPVRDLSCYEAKAKIETLLDAYRNAETEPDPTRHAGTGPAIRL
jgi:transposase